MFKEILVSPSKDPKIYEYMLHVKTITLKNLGEKHRNFGPHANTCMNTSKLSQKFPILFYYQQFGKVKYQTYNISKLLNQYCDPLRHTFKKD